MRAVAEAKEKAFVVLHPLEFWAFLGIELAVFELFHLHLTVAKVFVRSGVPVLVDREARKLPAFGEFLAEFAMELMQSDMLGDRDCMRPDQHRPFPSISWEGKVCRKTPETAWPLEESGPGRGRERGRERAESR